MILFVCTGNICRSAIGEIFFRHHSRRQLGADVFEDQPDAIQTASCGILAWDGAPVTRDALAVLKEAGIGDVRHTATAITTDLVKSASLVVAMTRDHAGGVILRHPPAREYTFLPGEILRHTKKYPLTEYLKRAEPLQRAEYTADIKPNRELKPKKIFESWITELNAIRSDTKSSVLGMAGDEIYDPAIGSLEDHRKVYSRVNELAELLAENLKGIGEAQKTGEAKK